ncbi:MAG: hypothetical protein HOF21_01520 [Nitrospina sp.]|jgi:hypothetical protein|nr:hypothetical protein [Nitrospina sp.]MBT5631960.1 hypothetical protein [Nitrospina sp.]
MIRTLIFFLAGILIPIHLFAESGPFSTPVPSSPGIKLSTLTDPDPVFPGERFQLFLSIQIEEGWHIYSLQPMDGNELLATRILIEDNVFQSVEYWKESSTHLIQDDAQAKMVKGHIAHAEFQNFFDVPELIKPGSYSINGKLLYRACDNNLCTLPQSLPFITRLQVGAKK